MRWPFTSGTTRGTAPSIRNAELLSMTTAPFAARGALSRLTPLPAENRTRSRPSGGSSGRTSTSYESPAKTSSSQRYEVRHTSGGGHGKSRSSSTASISRPTAPVAPTTATAYPSCPGFISIPRAWGGCEPRTPGPSAARDDTALLTRRDREKSALRAAVDRICRIRSRPASLSCWSRLTSRCSSAPSHLCRPRGRYVPRSPGVGEQALDLDVAGCHV